MQMEKQNCGIFVTSVVTLLLRDSFKLLKEEVKLKPLLETNYTHLNWLTDFVRCAPLM